MYWIRSVKCFGCGGCKAKLYGLYWVGVIYEYVLESDVVDVERFNYMGCTGWVWVGVIVGGVPRIVGIAED